MRAIEKGYLTLAFVFLTLHLVISNTFSTLCLYNSGVGFGLLPEFGQAAFFIGILALVIIAIFVKRSQRLYLLILGLAGLSNGLDRVVHGGVCDYIALPFLYTFNLNDVLIVISSTVFFLTLIQDENKSRGEK